MADLPDVLVALLREELDPVPFHDAKLPDKPGDRYVVGYFDDGLLTAGDVAHTSNLATYRFQLTYVGKSTQATRRVVSWLRNRCRAVLVDVVPEVDGWEFGPIELDLTQAVQRDEDVPSSPALFAVDQFVVMGARA